MKNYQGKQTAMAHVNFPFPIMQVADEFIEAIAEVKMAAARANARANLLPSSIAQAIEQTCREIIEKKHTQQFNLPGIQGGAGTSINMNVNEVVANRASELLKDKQTVHPNDHVNLCQSTNDVNPSALRIALIRLSSDIVEELNLMQHSFKKLAKKYAKDLKLARTHLQDAVPMRVGDEFESYTAIINRDIARIRAFMPYLYELNLGGTAVGNAVNAPLNYRKYVYTELAHITGFKVKPAKNLMSLTSSSGDFCHLQALITIAALDLSKIATDLRILSSGPLGGLGEITLEALQPGSSIMPGKVNPVALESMNQIYYFVSGKNITVQQAAEAAPLELAIMFPVIADSLISSIKLLTQGMKVMRIHCVDTLIVNTSRAAQLLEQSAAYATLLSPRLGYDITSQVVKKAIQDNKSIREVILEQKLMTAKELDKEINTQLKQ